MRNEIIKNYMRYLKLGRNFSKNTLDRSEERRVGKEC